MISVIGEALIDLVAQPASGSGAGRQYAALPGGSPFNVAIGLARLGQPTQLVARLSSDAFGRQLREHATANDVDLSAAVSAAEPSTLAVVGLDSAGVASYDFYREGTADWQWTAAELSRVEPGQWAHTGSLASWIEPGASVVAQFLTSLPADVVVSFDPNVRSALMADREAALARVHTLIGLADVVKASDEDVAWLYPGEGREQVLSRWAGMGPALSVITLGGDGAIYAQADGEPWTTQGLSVTVVDTVGAGDAFMAGLIHAVTSTGRAPAQLSPAQARTAVEDAITVAALTCQRAGADPPTAAELAAATSRDGV